MGIKTKKNKCWENKVQVRPVQINIKLDEILIAFVIISRFVFRMGLNFRMGIYN